MARKREQAVKEAELERIRYERLSPNFHRMGGKLCLIEGSLEWQVWSWLKKRESKRRTALRYTKNKREDHVPLPISDPVTVNANLSKKDSKAGRVRERLETCIRRKRELEAEAQELGYVITTLKNRLRRIAEE